MLEFFLDFYYSVAGTPLTPLTPLTPSTCNGLSCETAGCLVCRKIQQKCDNNKCIMCATLERPARPPDKLTDSSAGGATSAPAIVSFSSRGRISSNPEDEFETTKPSEGAGDGDDGEGERGRAGEGERGRAADDADRQNKKPLSDSLFPAQLAAAAGAAPPPPPPLPKKTVAPFQVSSFLGQKF
jgi:hypothetical protein